MGMRQYARQLLQRRARGLATEQIGASGIVSANDVLRQFSVIMVFVLASSDTLSSISSAVDKLVLLANGRFISAFALRLGRCYEASMDRDTAVAQIRKACNGISVELMKINPAVSALGDKEAQDEIYRTVFELTKEVETIKKRLAKLERSDDSRDL